MLIDFNESKIIQVTLVEEITEIQFANTVEFDNNNDNRYILIVKQDEVGNRRIKWMDNIVWYRNLHNENLPVTLSTGANVIDILTIAEVKGEYRIDYSLNYI